MIKVTMDQTTDKKPVISDISHLTYEDYIGKYIQLPVLPTHLGGYIWAKVIGVLPEEDGLIFKTSEGYSSFKYAYLPKKYDKMD